MTQKYIVEVNEQGEQVGTAQPYVPQQTPAIQDVNIFSIVRMVVIAVIVLIAIAKSIVIVKQQSIKVIQRLGKFNRVLKAGFSFRIPLVETVAGEVDLKVNQLIVEADTKTKDNVFVKVIVAVQYFVIPEKAYEAFYKLTAPQKQISSYVFDTVRAQVPKLILDEVFEKKDEIAQAVKLELTKTMDDFGYGILTSLVTDIDPDAKVKESMNEINAQQRLRVAANEKGEAEKILKVKNAEAEAESKKLQGVGIANERQAIVEGLEKSIEIMSNKTGISGSEVLNILMLTQYFDTLKTIGGDGKVIFIPHEPSGLSNISNQIRNAVISGIEAKA